MAADSSSTEGVPPEEDAEKQATYWLGQITFAEKKVKQFRTRGNQIVRRYKNMRSTAVPSVTNITVGQRRMNVLWANVETLKPVLFAHTPKPNVSRRNKDKDPVGRWASIVLERTLSNSIDMQPFDHVLTQDIENVLLPGYGCSMIEYVPKFDEAEEPEPLEGNEGDEQNAPEAAQPQETIAWQEAKLRYVHWRDQLTNPARFWQEVWWWGYVSYLTRKEVATSYGPEIAAEITLDHKASKDAEDSMAKATVWCIWDKTDKKVIHVSPGYPKAILLEADPPCEFEGFFPIPRPLFATTATDSIIPVPDFDQYQDQADEIDMFTQRIYVLGRSLRLRGLYPGDMQSVRQMMDEGGDADLIPVENFQMLQERGGAKGLVEWFPIDMVAKTLEWCYAARDKALAVMFEITGISDIMRAATDPQETATAQQLKSQYGGIRIRDRQRDVARYIRELLRHMSSVIGQHFTLEVLQKMSGAPLLTQQQKQMVQLAQQAWQRFGQQQQAFQQMQQQPPQPGVVAMPLQPPQPPQMPQPTPDMLKAMQEPAWEEVMALLRDEQLRGFVIDVETDSTVEADQMMQQQKATQFLTGVAQFMEAMLPVVQAAPELADLTGELLMYGVRHYKAGETIETQVEDAVQAIKQKATQPPPPDPKMQTEAVKSEGQKAKTQADMQIAGLDAHTAGVRAVAEEKKAQLGVVEAVVEHHANQADRAAELAIARAQPKPEAGA